MRYEGFDLIIEMNDIGKVHVLEQDVLVYKKIESLRLRDGMNCPAVAQLLLPKGARIVVPIGYFLDLPSKGKLRTNKAIVTGIIPLDDNKKFSDFDKPNERRKFISYHSSKFEYDFGKELKVRLNTETHTACRPGVHFFTEQRRAEKY